MRFAKKMGTNAALPRRVASVVSVPTSSSSPQRRFLARASMALLAAMAAVLVALAVSAALCPNTAYAADGKKDYTYTVRLYAGNQGTVDGKECVVYRDLSAGARWSFNPKIVKVDNGSKYYVKGIRVAGRDNDTVKLVNNTSSFIVNSDVDLVVVYGMKGSITHYTVNYVDEDGRELAPSQTYEGNVGDRPVVAYRYINGYRPQAYNLTGTLSKDEADNTFTFVYSPLASDEGSGATAGGSGGTGASTGGGTAGGTTGGNAGQGGTTTGGTGGAGGTDEGAAGQNNQEGTVEDNPTPTTDVPDNETPLADTPEEIESIDNDEVPLAANANKGSQVLWGLASPVGIIVAVLVLVVIGIVVWRLVVMRKRSQSGLRHH